MEDQCPQAFEITANCTSQLWGVRLNIVCQATVTISRAEFSTTATVYLQKNAPLNLLLGTDVQEAVGIQVLVTTEGEDVNLLAVTEPGLASPETRVDT